MPIAFWMCVVFGLGCVIASFQTMRLMQRALSVRGSEITFEKAGGRVLLRCSDVVSGERRWGGEIRFHFRDGTVVDVDPYARKADYLIERLSDQLAAEPR